MLIPAILKKEEIVTAMKKIYYTEDMIYESGGMYNWCPDIAESPDEGLFQYAVVDSENKLIGFITYRVEWYASYAHNFGIIAFKKNTAEFAYALKEVLNNLINVYKLHRVEWSVVCGNPVEKHYDRFCKKYNGQKYVLHDVIRDRTGNYRNSAIYEIVFNREEKNDCLS